MALFSPTSPHHDRTPRRERTSGAIRRWCPRESVAGRALASVIAIMTFLAALTAGFAFVLADASREWRGSVGQEMTIQVTPRPGRDIEADAAKAAQIAGGFSGVAEARAFTRAAIGGIAFALARRGPRSEPIADAAHDRGAAGPARPARRDRPARRTRRRLAQRHARQPRRLDAKARYDGASGRRRGHRHFSAGVDRHGARHRFRHARRDGRQSRHHRGAAFRRRGGRIHRPPVPVSFSASGPARRRGGRRRGDPVVPGARRFLSRQWTTSASGEQAEALFGSFSLGWSGVAVIAVHFARRGAVDRPDVARHRLSQPWRLCAWKSARFDCA